MAKVIAPNKEYNGVSAGVRFVNGEAECSDSWTIKWFKKHGYRVEETAEQPDGILGSGENENSERKKNSAADTGTADDEKTVESDSNKSEGEAETTVENTSEKGDTTKSGMKPRGRRKADK